MNQPPGAFAGGGLGGPMGGAIDLVSQNQGDVVRKVHARDLAAGVVTALFRLVKLATLHSLDNQAIVRQVEETVQIVGEYGARTGHNVSVLFAQGSVFVGGQLLRANRGVYEGALELGEILGRVGGAEIGIMKDARAQDFYAFASALADALRHAKPPRVDRPSPRIRLRAMSASALGREILGQEKLDPTTQVARTYASAVVIMRRFFEQIRRGKYELPQRVKRVAQRLVDLSAGETPAFLGVTAARNQNHDDAGRAVNTAILALAMARQVSPDVAMLVRVAMAALLYDVARPRLAGITGENPPLIIPNLSESQDNDAPAGTAVVITALSRVNEPGIMRTVMTYEAHWLKRVARLGPLYRGLRPASLQARIIHTSRAFNDLLTPAMGEQALTADQAVAKIESEITDAADRTVLRLLLGTLGIFPVGTLVELSTNEVALVVNTPPHPALYSQPRVRLVFDAQGGAIQRPTEVDLAAPRRGDAPRHIRRVVATSDDPNAASLRALAAQPIAQPMQPMQHPMAAHPQAQHQPIAMPPMQPQYGAPMQHPGMTPHPSGVRPAEPVGFGAPQPQFTPTPVSHEQFRAPFAPQPTPAQPVPQQPNLRRSQQVFEVQEDPRPNLRRSQQVFEVQEDPRPNPRRSQQVYEINEDEASYEALEEPPPQDSFERQGYAPPHDDAHDPHENGGATRALAWEEAAELLNQDAETDHGGAESTDESAPPPPLPQEPSEPPPAPEDDAVEIGHDGLPNIAPTAQGTFAKTPLVHLLVYMLDQKLTGSTIVTSPDGVRHTIYFSSGMAAKVKTGAMVAPLDRVILDQGLLDEATLRGTLMEISKKQILHGRHLVQKGLLERNVVLTVLRTQLLAKLTYLFELPGETTYAYYDGINLLETHAGPELTPYEPLAVIMAGIRLRANDKLVDATLERLTGRPIGLHLDSQVKRFEMHRDEQAIVDVLRTKRMTLQEIYDAGVGRQERVVRLTLYALAITRQIDLGTGGKPPVGVDVTIDSAPATQPEQTRPIRLAPPAKPMERLPTHPTAVDPSSKIERSKTGATDVGKPLERTPTGAGTPKPMERTRTGAGTPKPLERTRTGAGTPKPMERTPTGAGEPKPARTRTGAIDVGPPMERTRTGAGTPKPMERQPTGSTDVGKPMERTATGAGAPRRTGFGMGFGTPATGPQHKPTTKLARQGTGTHAASSGPASEPPASRRSGPPPSNPRSPPMQEPPAYAAARFTPDESDHYPRGTFAPEPVVPVRAPAPPMQRQPTPATRGAWQQPMAAEPQPSWPPQGSQQPSWSPQPPQAAARPQPAPMPSQPPMRTPVPPAPQQQVFAPSYPPGAPTGYGPPIASPAMNAPSAPAAPSAPPMATPSVAPMAPPIAQSSAPPAARSMVPEAARQPPQPQARPQPPAQARPQQPPTPSNPPLASPIAPSAPPMRSPTTSSGQPITSSGAPPGNPSRPAAPKPGDPKRRAEIEAKSEAIDKEDFFQMLGVQRSATQQEIQKAYFAFAKAWHPDRVPGDLSDLKSQVARVFAKLNEAYQTLSDPQKRREYEQTVAQGGGTGAEQEEVARVVDAALEFQKAEVLLKKNDLPAAEALARRAAQADPEQLDYVALLTWIQALRRGDPPPMKEGQTTTHFDDLIRILDGLLKKEPQYERALYYRGVLQKRAGRNDKAIRDFRAVAELNPKHIDAMREVRLYEMRNKKGKKGGGGGGEGGIFGKFFKS